MRRCSVAQAILNGLGFAGEHLRIVGAARCRGCSRAAVAGPRRARGAARADPALLRFDAALRRPAATTVRRPRASPSSPTSGRRSISRSSICCAKRRPGRRDRAAGAGGGPEPVRRSRGRPREVHALPGLRRRVPGRRAARQPRFAAPQLHREELRAVRPVREHLPGRRDHARAAPAPRRRRQGAPPAARPQRSRAVPLHPLRQAVRHAARDRGDGRAALRPCDVPGRAAERLQMCGDCRVIDLHSDPGEVRITEL